MAIKSLLYSSPDTSNLIKDIHPNINFKYNSFNVCLGKPGSGKSTLVLSELIKLNYVCDHDFDKIIYVAEDMNDRTFSILKSKISIPIYFVNYEDSIDKLEEFAKTDPNSHKNTFIFLEDSTFKFIGTSSLWNNWICKLRHLKWTVWANIHLWKTLPLNFKNQANALFIFKGYSRQQMQVIYRNCSLCYDFSHLFYKYSSMNSNNVLKIDNDDQKVKLLLI